ncbi:MAG: rubredoxin [Burkholderiales bacterium]
MENKAHAPAVGFKTLQCALCAFVYDEEAGMPEEGIPPGTRWEDVPETWSCPDCSATKSEFYMIEI